MAQISDREGNLEAFDNSTTRLERLGAQVLSRLRHYLGQLLLYMFATEELPELCANGSCVHVLSFCISPDLLHDLVCSLLQSLMRGRFCTFLWRYRPLSDDLWTRDGCKLEAYRCGVRQGNLRYFLSALRALTILRFVALRLEFPGSTHQLITLVRIDLARTCSRHTNRQIDVIIIAS